MTSAHAAAGAGKRAMPPRTSAGTIARPRTVRAACRSILIPARHFAVIPAAGHGVRFGSHPMPKQYLSLAGKPVIQHALERIAAYFPLQRLYVVVAPADRWVDELVTLPPQAKVLRCGGGSRAETVHNALLRMSDCAPADWVIVHDAVRPCLTEQEAVRLQLALADDAVGGFLAVPLSDSLKRVDEARRVVRSEPRAGLWRAQTPQMFRYGVLQQALSAPDAADCTDEAQAVEQLGFTARAVPGSACNVKITLPDDMALAEAILAASASRSGEDAQAAGFGTA
jgi:2-C-methyl-D-erythritol 4-phosphate cytidylyltransferase